MLSFAQHSAARCTALTCSLSWPTQLVCKHDSSARAPEHACAPRAVNWHRRQAAFRAPMQPARLERGVLPFVIGWRALGSAGVPVQRLRRRQREQVQLAAAEAAYNRQQAHDRECGPDQQQQQRQQRGWHPLAARFAVTGALAAGALLAAVSPASAAACPPVQPLAGGAVAAASAAVHRAPRQRQHLGFASVGIGSASPAFRSERAFDVAGFKLAGVLQQLLSAHIFVKIVALILLGAPVIWAWGCLYAAITGAPISLGVFKVVSCSAVASRWHGCRCSLARYTAIPIPCALFAHSVGPAWLCPPFAVHCCVEGARGAGDGGDQPACGNSHQLGFHHGHVHFRSAHWSGQRRDQSQGEHACRVTCGIQGVVMLPYRMPQASSATPPMRFVLGLTAAGGCAPWQHSVGHSRSHSGARMEPTGASAAAPDGHQRAWGQQGAGQVSTALPTGRAALRCLPLFQQGKQHVYGSSG